MVRLLVLAGCISFSGLLGVDGIGGEKAQPTKEAIERLIEQLDSEGYAEREDATKKLDAIGAPALELLRKAAATESLEASRRAEKLVFRIEQRLLVAKMLAPKAVRLNVKDVTVAEAVAELAKQSGYSLDITGDRVPFAGRKVTIDTGETTFWTALEKLCESAGLTEKAPLHAPGAAPIPSSPGPQPSTLLLADAKDLKLPTALAGAVRVRSVPTRLLNGKPSAPPKGEMQLVLDALAEPRLQGFGVMGPVTITKAVDDQDQELVPTPVPQSSTPNNRGGGGAVMIGGNGNVVIRGNVVINGVAINGLDSDHPAAGQRTTFVRFKEAAKPSKILKELSGTIAVEALAEMKAQATIENILDAAGKSVKGEDGSKLDIQSVKQEANGDIRIQLALERTAQNPLAGALGGMIRIQGMAAGAPTNPPKLFDAKGELIPLADSSSSGMDFNGGRTTRNLTLVYRPAAGQEPARLVQFGQRTVTFNVPFTLKNVPLQ